MKKPIKKLRNLLKSKKDKHICPYCKIELTEYKDATGEISYECDICNYKEVKK